MPQVPVYQRNVQDAQLPGVRVNTELPADTFGGGKSSEQVFGSAIGAASATEKYFQEEKQKADNVAGIGFRNQLLDLRTKLQYDPTTGFLSKKGSQVKGLPDQVKGDWNQGIESIRSGANNETQRMVFDKMAVEEGGDLNRDLQKHLFVENHQYDKDTTEANVKLERGNAANHFNDPEQVAGSIEKQKSAISGFGERNGLAPEVVQQQTNEAVSKTHGDVIDRILLASGGIDAKKYYDANSSQIAGDDKIGIEKKLEHAVNLDLGNATFNKFSQSARTADGYLDPAKLEAQVRGQDLPQKDIDQQMEVVRGRLTEDHQNVARAKESDRYAFMEGISKGRTDGWDVTEAKKFANASLKNTSDPYESALRLDAVEKMWAPPSESDPVVKQALWEKVQNGQANNKEIDDAFRTGKLNASGWDGLRKENYRVGHAGISDEEKSVWKDIKILATDQKLSKDDQAKFMSVVRDKSVDMSPQETYNVAVEEAKKVPKDHWWNWSSQRQFKVDYAKKIGDTTVVGAMKSELGEDAVTAIGSGVLMNKAEYGAQDVLNFAAKFGGFDKIKPGTPVHNAIISLQKRNVPVVEDNINYLLKKYPDGKW